MGNPFPLGLLRHRLSLMRLLTKTHGHGCDQEPLCGALYALRKQTVTDAGIRGKSGSTRDVSYVSSTLCR